MGLWKKFRSNYMIETLVSLKGNARACTWVEPLWAIPYNLYLPYVTMFMTTLGMTYAEIGYVTSILMASQFVFAILSGVITDKMGRRRSTVVFDVLSWSVPELLWMLSQNFAWFAVAAVFNGMWRITENSWYLLLVEDTDKDQIIALNSLEQLMGLLAAFFAPLSKFAVDAYGLVPTMRVFYGIACVFMTMKFLVLYKFSTETQNGLRRMEATKNKSIFRLVWECKDVYLSIIRQKRMLLTLGILATYTLVKTLNNDYWALYLRDVLMIQEGNVSLFITLRSLATLVSIFVIMPKVNHLSIRKPLLASLGCFFAAETLLLLNPGGVLCVPMLILSVILEAMAVCVLTPTTNAMLFINAEEDERARIVGMVHATVCLIVTVFPALIGRLAQISICIPFCINLVAFVVIGVLGVLLCKLPAAEE